MAFECSNCSPPIRSGRYVIINKVNGNINLVPSVNRPDGECPVVADPVAQIWEIEHLRDHEYHILATGPPPDLQGQPAVDRQELLYVIRNVQPEVWVICGEHNPTAPNESLYIIKKKLPIDSPVPPPTLPPSWMLASSTQGTQVQVIPPPLHPGSGCEVNRVPAVFTWHINGILN